MYQYLVISPIFGSIKNLVDTKKWTILVRNYQKYAKFWTAMTKVWQILDEKLPILAGESISYSGASPTSVFPTAPSPKLTASFSLLSSDPPNASLLPTSNCPPGLLLGREFLQAWEDSQKP